MELIDVLKMAYRKHVLDDDSIGWEELSDRLCDAICNEIGDNAFVAWTEKYLSKENRDE